MPRIVFMGSPDFAVPALEALQAHYPVIGVVTQPDRPAGRGGSLRAPAVKDTAQRLAIPLIQPSRLREPQAMDQLREWAPDLIVVAAFGQILRAEVLSLPLHGCINIHGSILPRWRGAAPIQAAILAGDRETGITIMKMDPGVDTGPILRQRYIPITAEDTAGSLFEKLAPLGAQLLLETLPGYLEGAIQPEPQPEQGVTYAPMLKKEDGRLDFSQSAVDLERRVRAMHPWPGAYLDWQGQPLKIHAAHILPASSARPSGEHVIQDGLPGICARDASILILDEVQPAGKKSMGGRAFLAGARNWA